MYKLTLEIQFAKKLLAYEKAAQQDKSLLEVKSAYEAAKNKFIRKRHADGKKKAEEDNNDFREPKKSRQAK